jgi:chemotaxis protein histidine kinase CheA
MGTIDLSDYKNLFLQTAKEYLESMSKGYLKLSSSPEDMESIKLVHLSSHSLKSQSQVMNLQNIVDICSNIEIKANDIINKLKKVDNDFLSQLKEAIDKVGLELGKIKE